MGLSEGFCDFYVSERRKFAWVWGGTSVLVLICWMVHVLPFLFGGVVSSGVVASRGCNSKGVSYTYSYAVDGQAYTGETQWGGWDGNGTCEQVAPGTVVPITYRADDPSRSLSGTVRSWTRALVHLLVGIAILCFVVIPVPAYIKELLG